MEVVRHNGHMKLGSFIGWGVVIYAIMRLTWDALVVYGFTFGYMPLIIELLVLVSMCIVAGRSLRFYTWKDIAPYSVSWAFVIVLLDMMFAVPNVGWYIYSDVHRWLGFALVAVIPLVAPYTRRVHHEMPVIS